MEEILKSGLINLTELGHRLYPDKTKKQAGNTLRAKVHKQAFNKLKQSEKEQIYKIIGNIEYSFRNELGL